MRDVRLRSVAPLALAALLVGVVEPAWSAPKNKTPDKIWTHPQFASFGVERIAMLPVATFNSDFQAASITESAIGQALRPLGYRWIGASITRDLLHAQPSGDSLVKVVNAKLLASPRVDSLAAPRVCGFLRCDAVLSVRIDQWEQYVPEANQAGKSNTTVQLHAALVDSLGRLLWSASGSNSMEGLYVDPSTGVRRVDEGGIERKSLPTQAGVPTYREVVTALVNRWAPQFPAKPAAPEAVPAPDSATAN